jgi:hypothetical protein
MGLFTAATPSKKGAKAEAQEPAPVGDDAAVRRAADAVAGCQQQAERVSAQHDAACERLRVLEANALEAERGGENVAEALADARRQVVMFADLQGMVERRAAAAEAAVGQALAEARQRAAAEYVGRITALLHEQEETLWRVRDQQMAIDRLAQRAFAEGVPIGIGESRYWSVGFPGFPFLRQDEAVLAWIRGRSIAPRWTTERGK